MTREIKIADSPEDFVVLASEAIAGVTADAVAANGFCTVALAGGTTPADVYRRLASEPMGGKVDFSKLFCFFGDERNVPPDDDSSNFKMVAGSLLRPLNKDESSIFRWRTELASAEATAADYENQLTKFFFRNESTKSAPSEERRIPRFDLIILGLGGDGHTASLFPHTPALRETDRLTAANWIDAINDFRFTITFPVINNAWNVIFLVSGEGKAAAARTVIEGEFRPDKFPAQLVAPISGRLLWIMDSAAAGLLRRA